MTHQDFTDLLAMASDQPQATFKGLCSLANDLVGVKLFTLTKIDPAKREATRIYTNMPSAYPLQGTKPMPEDAWSGHVMRRCRVFVANSIDDIAKVFFDHELIRSLGCESVINVPVAVGGRVIGTINCLHEARHFTPERVRLSHQLQLPGATAFLLQNSEFSKGVDDGE